MNHRAQKLPTVMRNRVAMFLLTLMIVAVASVRGPGKPGNLQDRNDTSRLNYQARAIPSLLSWANIKARHDGRIENFMHNPFQFEKKPADQSPTLPPAKPAEITSIDEPPREPGHKPPGPKTPVFDRDYIGFLGPHQLRVAAFRKGGEIDVAIVGHVLDGTFIVRRIGPDSVDIGLVGQPKTKVTTVLLAND